MILDATFNFSTAQALSGIADQVSTNVYDAGVTTRKVFGGGGRPPKIVVTVTAIAGTTPNFRARLVGADNAALTLNPVILDDSGVSRTLVAGDLPLIHELLADDQLDAKRYYGVIYTMGGNADNTSTVNCNLGIDVASNLIH